ncbi:MAG: HlyD family efflux transporter periplasmic adaptor subunit [Pirellulaceae bacterium]|nr:HlyD family efflux transporter periplasmic adaptor subunit [Pirellulaceae bacterium]
MSDSQTTQDATTFELGESKLAIRDNLRFSAQRGRHGKTYLIEDEATGDFYRVGEGEYTFLSLLDGNTTLASALATTCSVVGSRAFNDQDAAQLCKWLVDTGLAVTKASTSSQRLNQRREKASTAKLVQGMNPISIRIPLFNPDRFVASTVKYLSWLFTPHAAVIWVAVCLFALISLAAGYDPDRQSGVEVFSRDNVFWLGASWLVLKLIHEFAHALACRRFGGRIRSCGVLFLLLIPLPFVDVTSAWRFGNKYHRILVSAAGMLAELFLAAIAAVVWLHADAGLISQIAANVMFAASVNTLIFNINPLMKFDGYHMLADYLELPNLAKYGNQHVMGVCRKYLLGLNASPLPWAGTRGTIVKAYGFGSLAWKILICVSLVLGAANLLPGVGFLIAMLATILWLAVPVGKFCKYLIFGSEFEQPNRARFATVFASAIMAAAILGTFVPSPTVITAPIVIEYEPLTVLRSETTGFVDRIHVEPDQIVQAGDVLITLRNPELEVQRVETTNLLQEARLAAAAQHKQQNIGAWQIEQENIQALQKQLAETERNVKQLTIRATQAGQVLFDDYDSLIGTYIMPGSELLSIGDPSNKKAIALVSQDDARHLDTAAGETVELRVWGYSGNLTGKVREVTPRVRNDLPHFAFAGMYGGPLTVVNRAQYEDADPEDTSQLVLLKPRFAMHIDLDHQTSEKLLSGQTGLAHLRMRSGALGSYLYLSVSNWIRARIQVTHGL